MFSLFFELPFFSCGNLFNLSLEVIGYEWHLCAIIRKKVEKSEESKDLKKYTPKNLYNSKHKQ